MRGRYGGTVLVFSLIVAGALAWAYHGGSRAHSSGPVSVAHGARLYETTCLSCHGPDGNGHGLAPVPAVPAPALNTLDPARWTPRRVAAIIRSGSPPMPRFGGVLSPGAIQSLALYVRSLERTPHRPR